MMHLLHFMHPPEMVDMAERAGFLPTSLRAQADQVFSVLAGLSGNTTTLDVELTLANGFVSLGFLPLGPAPRLQLR